VRPGKVASFCDIGSTKIHFDLYRNICGVPPVNARVCSRAICSSSRGVSHYPIDSHVTSLSLQTCLVCCNVTWTCEIWGYHSGVPHGSRRPGSTFSVKALGSYETSSTETAHPSTRRHILENLNPGDMDLAFT